MLRAALVDLGGTLALTSVMHAGLDHGVEDLSPLIAAAGFDDIHTGNTRFGSVGFVSGRVPA